VQRLTTLSVVIPARNEAGRIGRAIRAVDDVLARASIEHDLLVVDDASTDATGREALAEEVPCPLAVLSYPAAKGKGGALTTGFAAASGDFVAFIDADLEFPPHALVDLWRTVLGRSDPYRTCAAGVRSGDGRTRAERASSLLARAAIRLALRLPLRDTQAGLKLFPGWFARQVLTGAVESGWLADVEFLMLARASGLDVVGVPLRQERVRPRRATTREFLRCLPALARLAASAPSLQVAAARAYSAPRSAEPSDARASR